MYDRTKEELIVMNSTLQAKLDVAVDVLEKIASLKGDEDNKGAEYWMDRSVVEANNALSQIQTM